LPIGEKATEGVGVGEIFGEGEDEVEGGGEGVHEA